MRRGTGVWCAIVVLAVVVSAFCWTAGSEEAGTYKIRVDIDQGGSDVTNEVTQVCNVTLISNWSTKPVIVNTQVNLESEDDLKFIYDILSEIESHGWITSVFVTGDFASTHPEVVRKIENRGHYIGVYGWKDEDLSLLSYNEQLELIKKATSAVRRAVNNPEYVVDFKPQNLKYNDDTIKALQDLEMKSITAAFSANESFVVPVCENGW